MGVTMERAVHLARDEDQAPRGRGAASGEPTRQRPSGRGPGGGPSRGVVALLAVACVLGLGWWQRDAARDLLAPVVPARLAPLLAPLLDKPGAPASVAGEDAAKDTQKDAPADPNLVTLDAAGQTRLGLAFGPVETRRIVLPVRTPGTVAFDERRVTHLKPRAAGRVLSLAVQPGDAVRAGQTLATLDAAGLLEARNGLAEAQASLAEAQATEAVAALNLTRGQDLMKVSGVAQAEVDRRRVDLAKAQAATASARARVGLYTAQVARLAPEPGASPETSAIVSPIDGVVTSAALSLGQVVDTGSDAFTVADPRRILVLANLYGRDIDAVKAGDPATVTAPVPDRPVFEGRVRSVNAAIDPASNTAPARIEIANPDGRLRANMFVSVEIAADLDRSGTTMPAAALQLTEDGPVAFVRTGEDRFEKRALTLGVQRADWVEVTAGLSPGETVATAGSFGLKAILLRALLGSTD